LMFKELRAHLITIQSQAKGPAQEHRVSSVSIKDIPPSLTVRSLQA
jgi:hypothetical protein